MNTIILLNVPATRRNREQVDKTSHQINRASVHNDERAQQLADIEASGDEDAAECAAADLAREFPGS